MRPRPGYTLLELVVVVATAGVLLALAARPMTTLLDRTRVHAAARDLAFRFHVARDRALLRSGRVGVRLDTAAAVVTIVEEEGATHVRALGAIHGVTLRANRDSMTYLGTGLAHGAANLTAIVRRGAAAETVVVSRVGRVR